MSPGSPQPDDVPASSSKVIVVAPARRLRLHHYVWVVGTALVVAALLHWLGPILTPFLIGVILAYVGKPAVSWMEGKRVPRTVGALLVMLVALVLVLALILVLTPLVHNEFSQLTKRLPELAAGLYAQVGGGRYRGSLGGDRAVRPSWVSGGYSGRRGYPGFTRNP